MNFALKQRISNNSSIIVMAAGAGSLFLLNLILKEELSPRDFGLYSLLVTFIATVNSFGLIGIEQVILRKSSLQEGDQKITLSSSISTLLFISFLILVIIGIITTYLGLYGWNILHVLLTFSIGVIMLTYNIMRLLKRYHLSQILLNLWRVSLLIFVLIAYLTNSFPLNYNVINNVILFFVVVSACVCFYYYFKNVKLCKISFKNILKEDLIITGYFFLSLLTATIIAQGDRYFVENSFSLEKLGLYVFYSTLVLYPFNFIQNYLGFKFLIDFKLSENIRGNLFRKLKNVTFLIIPIVVSIFVLINLLENFVDINISLHYELIIIFALTGITKLFYSVFSSLIGAKAEARALRNMNVFFIIIISMIFMLSFSFITTIEGIALLFLCYWLFRSAIWGYYCSKIIDIKL